MRRDSSVVGSIKGVEMGEKRGFPAAEIELFSCRLVSYDLSNVAILRLLISTRYFFCTSIFGFCIITF